MNGQRSNEWFEWTKVFIVALAITFFVRTFLFAPIVVDGLSMLPTLEDNDKMLVNKIEYRINEPERFDVIVFHASDQRDFIKRIIGLPGEHVEVRDQNLFINGEKVSEPFLVDNNTNDATLYENFKLEELPGGYDTIPTDKYLVLGDNRGNSTDSRIIGLVSKSQIVGKTDVIFWPFKRWQSLNANEEFIDI